MTVLEWMREGDHSIRWQELRDLADAPAETIAAERARVATEGWGARLLALQGDDGQWDGGALFPRGLVGSTRRRPSDRARGPALDRHGTHAHAAACVRG